MPLVEPANPLSFADESSRHGEHVSRPVSALRISGIKPQYQAPMQTRRIPAKRLSDEARLLKDGRQLASRALRLSTQTPKVKVWVPLLCSFVLTGYYLYTLHKKAAGATEFPQTPPAPSAVVAETAPLPQMSTAQPQSPAATGNTDDNFVEIRKRAEEAHAARQFGDEAKLWQQFM